MVNEAYLNQLNGWFTQGSARRSGQRETGKVDRLDPFGLRVDHQRADRERDAVGNAALLGVQLDEPGLAGELIRQRPLPELQQQQRQGAAEQRGIEQIGHQKAKAETERAP